MTPQKKTHAIVLLSAGLDSTVNCYLTRQDYQSTQALYFNYGQKATLRELHRATQIAKELNISFMSVDLPWLKGLGQSALTSSVLLPQMVKLDDLQQTQQTAQQVWVPNRNAIFIHIAVAFAQNNPTDIIVGFNKEEAQTFPDNSKEFVDSINKSLEFSLLSQVQVKSYTLNMDKKEIVQLGKKNKVNFDLIWSCYEGYESPCRHCESCLRLQSALAAHS